MLVLSRRRDQKLRIGHDVTVTVIEVRGDKVRLGVVAPRHVAVHREEVYRACFPDGPPADTAADLEVRLVTAAHHAEFLATVLTGAALSDSARLALADLNRALADVWRPRQEQGGAA